MAAYDIQHTTYRIRHMTYDIHHTTCNILHTTYNIQHTTYNIQHTTYGIRPTHHTSWYVSRIYELLHLPQSHTGLHLLSRDWIQHVLAHPPYVVEQTIRGVDDSAHQALGEDILLG
jgi:hypothetical protein